MTVTPNLISVISVKEDARNLEYQKKKKKKKTKTSDIIWTKFKSVVLILLWIRFPVL